MILANIKRSGLLVAFCYIYCFSAPNAIAASGTTSGVFDVTATGASTYSIPITVPPGTAGLEPHISLQYSSQNVDGLLGVGWQLGGLSRISRCAATLAQDGFIDGVDFDGNDRLCLNGQRLIAVSGTYGESNTEYRTEINNFSKVVQNIGGINSTSSSFTVSTKAGLILEYGENDASFSAPGRSGNETYVWALREIRDRFGNYLTVHYSTDNITHENTVASIQYGANRNSGTPTYNKVIFSYESRTSALRRYLPGGSAQIIITKRLKTITTRADSSQVREYKFAYEASNSTARSRLASVTECGNKAQLEDCLPPTVFTYKDAVNGLASSPSLSPPGLYRMDDELRAELVDLNGDGLPDWVQAYENGERKTWINKRDHWELDSDYALPTPIYHGTERYGQFVDINADGLPDWVAARVDSMASTDYIAQATYLNTGHGWSLSSAYQPPTPIYVNEYQTTQFVDLNGDGLLDLVFAATAFLNTGTSWEQEDPSSNYNLPEQIFYITNDDRIFNTGMFVDINADGLADYVVAHNGSRATYINTGFGWARDASRDLPADIFSGLGQLGEFADVNNDGLTDYVLAYDLRYEPIDDRVGRVRDTYINTGDGWYSDPGYALRGSLFARVINLYTSIEGPSRRLGFLADISGDGLTDFLVSSRVDNNNASTIATWLNGSGTYCSPNPCTNQWLFVGTDERVSTPGALILNGVPTGTLSDIDGNGALDIVYSYDSNGQSLQAIDLNHAGLSDVLSGIKTGLGAVVRIEYSLLNDPTVYDRGISTIPNHQTVIGALAVVSAKESSNGVGGTFRQEYKYSTGLADRFGRGFRGFAKVTEKSVYTDTAKNTLEQTTYRLDFPYTGVPEQSEVRDAFGNILKKTEKVLSSLSTGGGSKFTYISDSNVTTYKLPPLSGTASIVNVSNYYDDFGNLTREVQTTSQSQFFAGFETETINTYDNNTGQWLIGKLRHQQITKTTPDGRSQTRTSRFEYDPVSGVLSDQFVEPGSSVELHTHYDFDFFGNTNLVTASGAGIETRTTSTDYDSRGQFPQVITNALGHTESHTYSSAHGGRLTLTGPNNLTTQWDYDAFGRQLLETRADGTSTATDYGRVNLGTRNECTRSPEGVLVCHLINEYGFRVITSNSDGSAHMVLTDVNEREILRGQTAFSGDLNIVETQYDERGNRLSISAPCVTSLPGGIRYDSSSVPYCQSAYRTYFKYDLRGRIIEKNAPIDQFITSGNITRIDYNGLEVTQTDAKGRVSSKGFDVVGQLIRSTDANGAATTYEYNSFGDLIGTTDPLGNTLTNVYDVRGRKISTSDPDMGHWTYEYDALDELKKQTDAKSQITTIDYDLLGRVIRRTEPGDVTEWYYDGQWKGALDATVKADDRTNSYDSSYYHQYDEFGRVIATGYSINNQSYGILRTYDAQSRLDELTYPLGLVAKYHYNTTGYLVEVTNKASGQSYWRLDATDAFGNLSAVTLGNGQSTVRNYDQARGTIDAILTGGSLGTETQSLSYERDRVGNLTARVDANQNGLEERFYYDNLNRLDYSTLNGVTNLDVDYDDSGNITSKSGVGEYSYDGPQAHAVSSITGARVAGYSYDANGNMTNGAGRSITWNAFNKPEIITEGSNTDALNYGPDRNRVWQVTQGTRFRIIIYVNDLYEQHFTHEGVTEGRSHIRVAGRTVATEVVRDNGTNDTLYLHRDHLDSVDVITDASGAVVQHLSFGAFGKRRLAAQWADDTSDSLSASVAPTFRGFTGHEHLDTVGLIHMNGRVYDPVTGRFTSPDPFVQFPGSTQGWNRFSYVSNNPLSRVDPSGYLETFTAVPNFGVAPFTPLPASLPAFSNGVGGLGFGGGFGSLPNLGTLASSLNTSLGQIGGTFAQASSSGNLHAMSGPSSSAYGNNFTGSVGGINSTVSGDGRVSGGARIVHGNVAGVSANGANSRSMAYTVGASNEGRGLARQDVYNGLNGIGGFAQIAAGVVACSTGVGCIAGTPLIVLGVSNIGEAATGFAAANGQGFNFTQGAIQRGVGSLGFENASGIATKTNAVVNLTFDLAGLNAPAIARRGFSLYYKLPNDYTARVIDGVTRTGLVLQGATTVNTTINAVAPAR